MADPRSYAGTVLPSGGVDPLRLMSQMQAQKQKRDAAAKTGTDKENQALKDIEMPKNPLLWRDNKEIEGEIKTIQDYMVNNPNWAVPGSKERETLKEMRYGLQRKMITSQKDREFFSEHLKARPSSPFREDYVQQMEAWGNMPLAERINIAPPKPIMSYDWKNDIKTGPGALPPEEWGWERTDPTGTMIEGASGRSLDLERVMENVKPFLSDDNVMRQAEFDAQKKMAQDPTFAARAQKNGFSPGAQMVVDYAESFAFGGGKQTLKDNPNVSFGAGDLDNANMLLNEHFAFIAGLSDKYGDKAEVVTLPDGKQANAKVATNVQGYVDKELGKKNGVDIKGTGKWVFVPDASGKGGRAYLEGTTGSGKPILVEQDPRNQYTMLGSLAQDRKIKAEAMDEQLRRKNAFDESTGTTRLPRDLATEQDTKELSGGGRIINEKGTIVLNDPILKNAIPSGHILKVNLDNGTFGEFDQTGYEVKRHKIPERELEVFRKEAKEKGWWTPGGGAFVPGAQTKPQSQSGGPFIPGK